MTKVTTEELNKVRELRKKTQEAANSLSSLHIDQTLIKRAIETAEQEFFNSVEEQDKYIKNLHTKYGDGSLDIETGEITS